MFGVEEEVGTETDGVLGENSETDMGLVLSEEDTTKGVSGQEVLEHRTDATEGSDTDTGTGRILIQSQKVTLCCTQSINRLCRVNLSSPSTAGKSWSSLVSKKQIFRKVPQGNLTEISDAEVIVPAKDPSRRRSPIGAIGEIGK